MFDWARKEEILRRIKEKNKTHAEMLEIHPTTYRLVQGYFKSKWNPFPKSCPYGEGLTFEEVFDRKVRAIFSDDYKGSPYGKCKFD